MHASLHVILSLTQAKVAEHNHARDLPHVAGAIGVKTAQAVSACLMAAACWFARHSMLVLLSAVCTVGVVVHVEYVRLQDRKLSSGRHRRRTGGLLLKTCSRGVCAVRMVEGADVAATEHGDADLSSPIVHL